MVGGLPVCKYDSTKRMFLVIKHKGKTLSNGGFGVTIQSANVKRQKPEISNDDYTEFSALSTPETYLFIEEAIFLHERGLIELWQASSSQGPATPMDSKLLYSSLQGVDGPLSLPVYLVYAHLRAQSYRVMRHTSRRRELLEELAKRTTHDSIHNNDTVSRSCKDIKDDLRDEAAYAAPPTCYEPGLSPTIAFDVYQPDSNFKRSNPGLPAFHVTVCSFVQSSPTFGELQQLIVSCGSIPLHIATVADSGTVVMFAITDVGVPIMKTT